MSKRKKILILLCAILGILAVFFGILALMAAKRIGKQPPPEREAQFAKLANYTNGKFVNEEPLVIVPAMKRVPMARFFRHFVGSCNKPDFELPKVALTEKSFLAVPGDWALYWLGHSSFLFELANKRFAVDPVFGNSAPVPFVARRYAESPLRRKDLPELDFMIITHDHYDHLEYETIRLIRDRDFPIITSLGVGDILRGWGIADRRITELNWGDKTQVAGITVTAVKARHFSGRSMGGRDKTLWASYIIEGGGKKIFFGADSGYGKHFKEIGDQYGPFDLVCLEIDAWNDRWPNTHLFPHQIPAAYNELRGKLFMPIHWGVFDLALHGWNESITKVKEETGKAAIPMITPLMGEKFIPGVTASSAWWEKQPK